MREQIPMPCPLGMVVSGCGAAKRWWWLVGVVLVVVVMSTAVVVWWSSGTWVDCGCGCRRRLRARSSGKNHSVCVRVLGRVYKRTLPASGGQFLEWFQGVARWGIRRMVMHHSLSKKKVKKERMV